jgi:hypothetical protein
MKKYKKENIDNIIKNELILDQQVIYKNFIYFEDEYYYEDDYYYDYHSYSYESENEALDWYYEEYLPLLEREDVIREILGEEAEAGFRILSGKICSW